MSDFINIKEASELTGKAEITIRRLVKRFIKKNPKQIKRSEAKNGYTYHIEKAFLLEKLNLTSLLSDQMDNSKEPLNDQSKKTETQEGLSEKVKVNDQLINPLKILQDELKIKNDQLKERDAFYKKQLDTKDKQLSKKDDQIDNLLERDREKNILIKNLQDQFLLQNPETEIFESAEEEKVKPKKKKGFFGRLFGGKDKNNVRRKN